jgi:hypothetical protein
MSAGGKYEYLWKVRAHPSLHAAMQSADLVSSAQDNGRYKKATRLSAPMYIDNLLNWCVPWRGGGDGGGGGYPLRTVFTCGHVVCRCAQGERADHEPCSLPRGRQ